ncbi:uncharacterized protein ACA1_283010 [Acanthamoeba castellanii str. Neff]|uniref:Uncharacterized protein n=1 Tax=Acanthamoeba castellanii (strain ATCC 30010 / Neff) TaxID=1257118 RepID=L8H7M1_ACACF|nr:uncharacterized protein ACA1_283010 [Acanthamoeba castellanii str. Neff]ELR21115.1 hypothetical protein ACA1_283010 [Acanthamoeba castellanii str. Neff]
MQQGEESSRAGGEANVAAEVVDLYGPDNEEYMRTPLVSPYPVPKLKVPEGVSRRFAARSGAPQQGGGGGYRDRGEEDRYQRSNRSEYEHHPRPPFRDHREGDHQGYADHQPQRPYASHKRSSPDDTRTTADDPSRRRRTDYAEDVHTRDRQERHRQQQQQQHHQHQQHPPRDAW